MKQNTRKIFAIIIFAIMVLTMIPITNSFAETDNKPRFAISRNIVMKRDETSELSATVNEKLNFIRFSTELDYDSNAIEIAGIEKGDILPDEAKLTVTRDETNNKITGFVIENDNEVAIDTNAGTLARIKVKANGDADLGKYPIEWIRAELLKDDNGSTDDIITVPGSVIITEVENSAPKCEFLMIYNRSMFPGEEQTISVEGNPINGKAQIHYIRTKLLYDDNFSVVEIEKGKDLPEDASLELYYDSVGRITGFSLTTDNVININPNCNLLNMKVRATSDADIGGSEFAIAWTCVINENWKEVIMENTIANIDIVAVSQPTPVIEKAWIEIPRTELMVGEEEKLQIVVEPEEATDQIEKIEYSSSDPEVATVSEDGMVKAIAQGKATIKAVINDEFVSEVEITVTNPDIPETSDMPIALFTAMLFASTLGIAYIVIRKNK